MGNTLLQRIFNKGIIFYQQLSRRNEVELTFDDNMHRLDSTRSCKRLSQRTNKSISLINSSLIPFLAVSMVDLSIEEDDAADDPIRDIMTLYDIQGGSIRIVEEDVGGRDPVSQDDETSVSQDDLTASYMV